MQVKGKLWEDGSGSVGLDTSEERTRKKDKVASDLYDCARQQDNRLADYYETVEGQQEYCGSFTPDEALTNGLLTPAERSTLGLSSATILRTFSRKPARKGLSGLTSHGKLMVRNSALRLQREIGKACLGLLTLTLPNLPADFIRVVEAKDWGDLEKSIYAWLTRKLKKNKLLDIGFCGVVEIQSIRFKRTGQAYPHWHFIFPIKRSKHSIGGTKYNPWTIDLNKVHPEFEKIVWRWFHHKIDDKGLNHKQLVKQFKDKCKTFNASVDLHPIKKDAAKYISKYLSKGSTIEDMNKKGLSHQIPFQWWYVSSVLKKRVVDKIVKLGGKLAEHIYFDYKALEYSELISWYRLLYYHYPDEDKEPSVIGVSFHATSQGIKYFNSY